MSYVCVTLTELPRLLHDVPAPPDGLLRHHDVVAAESESLGVQEVGEDLGEGGEQLAGVGAPVQLEKGVHQAVRGRPVLVLVKQA